MRKSRLLLGAMILAAASPITRGTTYYYWGSNHSETDANTSDWETASDWTINGTTAAGSYPGSSDTAIVESGEVEVGTGETVDVENIQLEGATSGDLLEVHNGGTLTVGSLLQSYTATLGGSFVEGADGNATINEFLAGANTNGTAVPLTFAINGGTVNVVNGITDGETLAARGFSPFPPARA
jgi:hypothetical protein